MKSQKSDINSPSKSTNNNLKPFQELIRELEVKMKLVFHDREDINKLAGKRGLTPFVLREIMSVNPLSIAVPKEYGGRGAITHETIKLLSTASYESLALSLIFGINTALFLQPVGKYGHEDVKASVFKNFLEHQTMGGLMITEPDFGSDALSMQTHYTEKDDKFHLKGTKHWAGLTGWADYWIVTARKKIQMG
ncbi:MAG: acyl-CoA dehydrogenase family protein, partial [Dysgonamonadaceae bacterium]|nr:acyl-CoA dehydrogenase family protein [Dysgonamonadaceae bacterium]